MKDNIEGEIAKLKQSGKDSYIFGSADLSATLMKLGLIDEYRICVCAVVLGGGTPLFKRKFGTNEITTAQYTGIEKRRCYTSICI